MTASQIAERLFAKSCGETKWEARCPGHEDHRASLAIGLGDDGRVLIHCHAGCDASRILAAAGLRPSDLFPTNRPGRMSKGRGVLGLVVASYPYRDELGELLFEVCRFEPKTFRQRHRGKPGEKIDREGWCWSMHGVRRALYRLPEILAAAKAGETIWIPEGEKDADALAALGLPASCNPMGAGKWSEEYVASFSGAACVVVIADRDEPGRTHAQMVAASISAAGIEVRVLEVKEGKDASDWISSGAKREDFEQLAKTMPPWRPLRPAAPFGGSDAAHDTRPEVELGPEEAEIVDRAEELIATDLALYQRAGLLVHIRRDLAAPKFLRRPAGAPQIAPLAVPNCREALSRVARWMGFDARRRQWFQKRAPGWIAEDLLARGQWIHVRPLVGVIESPILRPDGSVLSTPGYDSATGLVFEPSGPIPPILLHPTRDDAIAARDALLEIVAEFPFTSEAHRSAWLASALVFFGRFAIAGRIPLTLYEAPTAGTGKTLLADTIGVICTGRDLAKMANTLDDTEMRKRLLAIGLAGDSIVLLDNVRGGFGTPSLDMALTAGAIRDRVLGVSEEKTVPLDSIFFASGNNVEVLGDTRRRILHCRIDARTERPEERDGFRHPDLLSYVTAERHHLVAAALTILRAYHLAGRPIVGTVRPWGGFESWQSLVCGAVRWLGLAAPEDTRAGMIEAESEPERLGALLRAWATEQPNGGMTAVEAMRRVAASSDSPFAHAVAAACRSRGAGPPTSESIGYFLRRVRGRVISGLCFDRSKSDGDRHWFAAPPSPDGGDGGHVQSTREKLADNGVESLGGRVGTSAPSPPSGEKSTHGCDCGRTFSCPGAGCLCPDCGLPPVGGHRNPNQTKELPRGAAHA